jgi:hypothetical protein
MHLPKQAERPLICQHGREPQELLLQLSEGMQLLRLNRSIPAGQAHLPSQSASHLLQLRWKLM